MTVTAARPAYPTSALAEKIRASIPRITCKVCGITTTRSNPTDDMCDACHDNSAMAVMRASHGVPWLNGR